MVDSPLGIILQMITLLIDSIINTFKGIIALFGSLLESLGIVSEVGGPLGFGLSLIIIAAVGFFITKVFLGGGKKLIVLILVGLVLAYILLLSAFV